MACHSSCQAIAERRLSHRGASSPGLAHESPARPYARGHLAQSRYIGLCKCRAGRDTSVTNGVAASAQASQVKPHVAQPTKVRTSPSRERYGWPDRSDMYILRTDGNACARTLVRGTGRLQLAYPSSHQYMMVWKQKPRTVMLIKKLGDELLHELLTTVKYLLEVEKLNVVVEPAVHHRLSVMGECSGVYTYTPDQGKRLGEFIDFVICLGGDGVLLHTALLFGANVPPIIAFHLGSLGFMSQHNYEHMREDLAGVIHGHEPLENCKVSGDCENSTGVFVSLRMRLLCEITRKGKLGIEQKHEVLNEVVLDRGASSFLTNINVYESGNFLTCVQADGVMIATPTGSTAYSAAAGGSMVHPNVPAILFTPVCPHSLNFRPIVLPDYADLELRIAPGARASAWVSFDGKYRQELHEGDVMRVRMSPNPVATINRVDQTQDWMSSLNRCFGWSHRMLQRPFHSIDGMDSNGDNPAMLRSELDW